MFIEQEGLQEENTVSVGSHFLSNYSYSVPFDVVGFNF